MDNLIMAVEKIYSRNNEKEAFELLFENAKDGNPEIINRLALCYSNGRGVEPNENLAIEWWEQAAEKGFVYAQYNLGFTFYYMGDYEQSVKWFEKAAEQGLPDSQYYLGICYANGYSVEKDIEKAIFWYLKAAEQGHSNAQNNLGFCFDYKDEAIYDTEKAKFWYTKAAELGNITAQFNLGMSYYNDKNYNNAFTWFAKAAEQGHSDAQYYLGVFYANGYGIDKNYDNAVHWYEKAAKQGNLSAQNNLADCYDWGNGVTQNSDLAIHYYTQAANQGNTAAQKNLGYTYKEGAGVKKDYKQALYWYEQAAVQNNEEAKKEVRKLKKKIKSIKICKISAVVIALSTLAAMVVEKILGYSMIIDFLKIMGIIYIPIVIIYVISIVFHEFAHSFVAYKLGDYTIKSRGLLTWNPKKYNLSLTGAYTTMNSEKFASPKVDDGIASFAGPLSNFLFAFFAYLILQLSAFEGWSFPPVILYSFFMIFYFNIYLGLLNMLPIPSLDGAKVLAAILPDRVNIYFQNMTNKVPFKLREALHFIFLVILPNLLGLLIPVYLYYKTF